MGEEMQVDRGLEGRLLDVRALAIPDLAGALELLLGDAAGEVPDLPVIGELALHRIGIEIAEIFGTDLGEDLFDRRRLHPRPRAVHRLRISLRPRPSGD